MVAIQTTGLTKRFKDKTAVDNLNLSIENGELFALLGVNGAGKTTTIKMLSGLCSPTSGDAVLLGDSIVKAAHKVKENTNVSPQETAVARNLTVRENLELIAGIYGADKKAAKEKAENMIKSFALGEVADKKAKILSGGFQRRLSIAMALISDPKILFLDEPTLGLDVLARRELWKAIGALKGKVTMILTTHYMEEAEALSDRIGIMSDGHLKAVGTAKELIAQTNAKNFEDAFIALATETEATAL
ncbi:MAG TPA: ABC transporter A family member [Oscillospiraceae bacterium]|nr:ABC transporter A family member [Oscillospiraceae bacterium]HPK36539.1 ABC transporter A family member [Oscillospiraceae bacterium]HPR75516.1 ABC transporter A family member [Oscillospiraceae bacterium]